MAAIVGTSTGYVGTAPAPSIGGDKWAKFQAMFGNEYFVASSAAARVTVQTGLTVRIAAGASSGSPQYIGGGGVIDALTGSVDLVLPTPGSDGTTYRPVYARRTWGATNATTFEYGASVTTQTLPARSNDPGVSTDEQPLALVRIVKAGSTLTATVVDDLRAVGYSKGYYEASSELVLSYMNKPGYRIRIAGTEWLRTMAGAWEKIASPSTDTDWSAESITLTNYSGVTLSRRIKNGWGALLIRGTRSSGQITGVDAHFFTLGSNWLAGGAVYGQATVNSTFYRAYITPGGEVHVDPFTIQAGQNFQIYITWPIG